MPGLPDAARPVSVILPAYNAAGTVEAAVRSVAQQTYPPLEILVVDDGSTDETVVVVERLNHPLVKLIQLPENCGPSAARNAALDAARGNVIAYLDADDRWHPEKLARCLAAWDAQPDAVLLYHDRIAGPFPPLSTRPVRHQTWRALLLKNPVATPAALHPASLALRWSEGMRHMEDHDFFLRCAEKGPVLYLPEKLVQLGRPLLSAGGLSADRKAMRRGEREVFRAAASRRPGLRILLPLLLAASHVKAWSRPFRAVR